MPTATPAADNRFRREPVQVNCRDCASGVVARSLTSAGDGRGPGRAAGQPWVLAWLQPLQPALFTPEAFPVFNLQVDEGRYYGFPVYEVPGYKFCSVIGEILADLATGDGTTRHDIGFPRLQRPAMARGMPVAAE